MRIFSKHQDYYDSVRAYGADPNVIYKRFESTVDKNDHLAILTNSRALDVINKMPSSYANDIEKHPRLFYSNLIFFCGNIYPCFVFKYLIKGQEHSESCYTLSQVKKLIRQRGSKEQKDSWFNKKHKSIYYKPFSKMVIQFFDYIEEFQNNQRFINLHHEFGTPVFSVEIRKYEWQVILNPILKKYKFYKAFDTFRAYQEISMFISGVLGGQSPPIVEISDRCRKEMHGFDKWSFRKEPTKGRSIK